MAEASDLKFGTLLLGFAKVHLKITPRVKVGVAWARGAPERQKFWGSL